MQKVRNNAIKGYIGSLLYQLKYDIKYTSKIYLIKYFLSFIVCYTGYKFQDWSSIIEFKGHTIMTIGSCNNILQQLKKYSLSGRIMNDFGRIAIGKTYSQSLRTSNLLWL